MAFKSLKSRWSKKEKAEALESLRNCLGQKQHIMFVEMPTHEYDWMIIATWTPNPDKEILVISKAVACALGRTYVAGSLRGVTYDSPEIILVELQNALEFTKPFKVGKFSWI